MKAFWVPRHEFSISFGLVSRPLFVSIVDSKFRRLGFLSPGFRIGSIAKKQLFTEIVFYELRGRILLLFGSVGSSFSDFCCPGDKLENGWVFGGVTDPESGGWWW